MIVGAGISVNAFFSITDATPSPQSVFRERELSSASSNAAPSNLGYYSNGRSELAQEFMREINDERNRERDELYRENLRNVLSKYEQEEENAIEREILSDELQRNAIIEGARLQQELKDRNQHNQAPQWNGDKAERIIEKRRLTLPWLPASRRKRFPISKRSPVSHGEKHDSKVTNEQVAHDLQAIFGDASRGSVDMKQFPAVHHMAKKSDRNVERHAHHVHGDGSESGEDDHSHEDDEHDHEHSHEDHTDHHDDDDEDDDDEDRKKKKKRSTVVEAKPNITSAHSQPEELKLDQLVSSTSAQSNESEPQAKKVAKKSIEWSKYFGLDRKKKSVDDWFMGLHK